MSDFQLTPTDAAVVINALDRWIGELKGDIHRMDDQPWNHYDTSAQRLELASAKEDRGRIMTWAKETSHDD